MRPPSLIRGGCRRAAGVLSLPPHTAREGSADERAMSWEEVTVLVDRAKAGDRQAYGELVERFRGSVYALAVQRVRNPAEADELTQEVFVHAMRKLPQLRDAAVLRRLAAADRPPAWPSTG